MAVVAPGSRSTPLALALLDRAELAVHVVHDERVAAFVALGAGLDGVPAVLLCTSGTAAANFHPAVVEAGLSDVPMIVITADRPPELRDVGAPQAIDQTHLYGRSVRWFHDPGVPDAAAAPVWRSLGARAVAAAADRPGAPQPAVPRAARRHCRDRCRRAAARRRRRPPRRSPRPIGALVDLLRPAARPRARRRGGRRTRRRGPARRRHRLAAARRSGLGLSRRPGRDRRRRRPPAPPAGSPPSAPDVVVRLGRPATSKVLAQWVAASGAPVRAGRRTRRHRSRPPRRRRTSTPSALAGLGRRARRRRRPGLGGAVVGRRRPRRGRHRPSPRPGGAAERAGWWPAWSPATVRPAAALVVAASMPMRDLEWFGGVAAVAHANRGANGIDGVVSTALGAALATGAPTIVAGRRHRLRPRRRRADRRSPRAAPTCASSSSTTTAAGSSRSCRRRPSSRRIGSSSSSARPTAPTSSPSPPPTASTPPP